MASSLRRWLSSARVERFGDEPNVHLFNGYLNDLNFEPKSFDVIAVLESLFYMPNPRNELSHIESHSQRRRAAGDRDAGLYLSTTETQRAIELRLARQPLFVDGFASFLFFRAHIVTAAQELGISNF